MLMCQDCEFFKGDEDGKIGFACDPFRNVKEPECLLKWQLIKINEMVQAYQTTLNYYQKLAPMQDKLFKAMEREIDEMTESESWKDQEDEEAEEEGEDQEDRDDDHTSSW